MNTRELDDFLSQVETRSTTISAANNIEQPTQQELDEEEQAQLVAFAMSNLGLLGSEEQEENDEDEDEYEDDDEVEEVEPEPEEDTTPANERPVVMPDYTNIREELQRFSDAEWFTKVQEKTIILAGIGGIGSNMAIILAKLNPRAIYIFDGDYVESVNMAGQFYSYQDIGMPKTTALARTISQYTNYSSLVSLERFYNRRESIVGDIMICGFDSMRARMEYFKIWKERTLSLPESERKECLFMDGRLTATEFQIFCMTGEDTYYMETYQNEYLFNDYEAIDLPCSFKQTGYLAQMIGSFMVNLFVNFCANQVNPARNMSLPFLTHYRGDMMYLESRR